MDRLAALRIAPLRLRLVTAGPFRSPEYRGALFRGGFGQFFRDLACQTKMPSCSGCQHLAACPYSLVFETPVLPDKFSVLRKYPNAPHPFVLVPPLDQRTLLPAGAELTLDLTLIGSGIEHLPHFIAVFEAMGRSGRYGGPFRIKSLVSALDAGQLVYEGATRRILRTPPLWQMPSQHPHVHRITLDFLTPLRIRTDGRYNASPDFVAITHALLRRIHLLTAVHGPGDGDAAWMHPLLAQADTILTETAQFRLFQWDRHSGRQDRRIPMDGLLGTLTAAGDLTPLAPFFHAGEWLNVGSGTSMGMGKYRITSRD